MDEPTSALDPISTSKIEDLAVELKKDYTIVMVTHNMQQALRISDSTAFFLLGEGIGVRGYLGAALMLVSLLIMELDVPALLKKDEKAP